MLFLTQDKGYEYLVGEGLCTLPFILDDYFI